jgi:hypothetical protein
MQVLSPGARLTTLIVSLPNSTTASAAANSILAQANELLAAAASDTAGSSSSSQYPQAPFHECHLLAYAASSAGYPQSKSTAAAAAAEGGESHQESALQQHISAYSKRRAGLLGGRAQLREIDASERLNEPWWFENELLVLLLPADPEAAAAAAAAAAYARVGSKRSASSRDAAAAAAAAAAKQWYMLVLQSVQNKGYFDDEGSLLLPVLLPVSRDATVQQVLQSVQVGSALVAAATAKPLRLSYRACTCCTQLARKSSTQSSNRIEYLCGLP